MTREEHMLMVYMLAQQQQRLLAIVEALKSKDVLEADALAAYDALLYEEQDDSRHSFVQVAQQYEKYAKALGIPVNLKDPDRG
jgi:hypothetical protein